MKIDIDVLRKSPKSPPLYKQLKELLKGAIAAGVYQPGERIASEREIIAAGNLSYPTVSKALRELAEEGLLVRKVGRGTVVAEHPCRTLKRVACIYYNCETPLFTRLKSGVQRECDACGIDVDYIQTGLTATENSAAMRKLVGKKPYDAIIGFPMENMECNIRLFQKQLDDMPVILFGSYYLTFDCDLISWDPTPALHEAVECLLQQGIQDVALVTSKPRYPFNALQNMTRQAILDLTGSLGLKEISYDFKEGNLESAIEECHEWMRARNGKPAIVCDSDGMARAMIESLSKKDVLFPRDYLIIGSGNMPKYCGTPPDLSTVDWPLEEMGRMAIRHLQMPTAIRNGRRCCIVCQTRFIARKSTAGR